MVWCRSIVTDEYLCVKGSDGTIFALGDAATVEQAKALSRAKVSPTLPFQILRTFLQYRNAFLLSPVVSAFSFPV